MRVLSTMPRAGLILYFRHHVARESGAERRVCAVSKFNQRPNDYTVNREGMPACAMADRIKLVTQVLTSFFNEQKFYGDNSAEMELTIRRVIRQDADFVSRLAVYARREFNMRSVAHVLTAYLAHEPEGKPFVRRTVRGIVRRGDDVTELMAFYLSAFGKPIPNALRKGICDVFAGFDEYTLAKYRGKGKAVSMKDIVMLCHPRPVDEAQAALWKRLLEGRLQTPVTWETQLAAKGNTRETWEELIDSGKVGYMALLRNLRNIQQAAPRNIGKVWKTIEDPEAVRRSRQLPFRFLSAYREISDIAGRRALDALERAVRAAVSNLPRIPGTTVIAVDTSGSMSGRLSRKSSVRCCEVGMMLGLIANRICEDSLFYTFDTTIEKYPLTSHAAILETCMRHSAAGGGTQMGLPFEVMLRYGIRADRIIIISDNECNFYGSRSPSPVQTLADKYRQQSGSDLWVHAIDLMGYGTQQFAGARTNIISGWSEKVFDFILLAEQGAGGLEETVARYEWQ